MPLKYRGVVNFTGGELSPQMSLRIDTPQYNVAAKEMQNFYTVIQGGAKKRRGQAYVATASDSSHSVGLIPYVLNTTYSYLIIINNGTMQFIKNGNLISAYSINCPYQDADLPYLRYSQSGSIVYLTHPNYPPMSLQTFGDTDWSLEPTQFTYNATSDISFSNAYINFQIINSDNVFQVGSQALIQTFNGDVNYYTPILTLPYQLAAQDVNLASDGRNFDISTGGIGTSDAPIIMDGINLEVGFFVLLKDQSTPSENGIYEINSGSWTRATWYSTAAEINNSCVHVDYGLIWGNQYFNQTATIATVGTDIPIFDWTQSPPGDGEMGGVTSQLGGTGQYNWLITCLTSSDTGQTWQVLGVPAVSSGSGSAVFNGSISGTTLTVNSVTSGTIVIGQGVYGDGVPSGTIIVSGSGTNWTLNTTVTIASENMSSSGTQLNLVPTYVSATQFTVPGNFTSYFPTYEILQFDNPTTTNIQNPPQVGTIPQGWVTSSSFGGGITTVNIKVFDSSGPMPTDLSQVSIYAVSMWKPGAYPASCCFFQQRFFFGGSAQFPQYVWGSRAGGYYLDLTNGITADMGIIEEIAGNDYAQILHLVPSRQLLILTTSTEYAMEGPSDGPLSGISSNIVNDYTKNGCSVTARPIRIGKEVLFTQRDGLKVRALSYELVSDSNIAPDITLFSNHLTTNGPIIASSFAQNPDYISWFVTNDGRLLSCLFDRDQELVAWAEHTTSGNYEAICSVPGIDSDFTYVVVNRTIAGQTVRTIELMDYTQGEVNTLGGPSMADCFFTASFGSATNTVSGLPSFMYNATGVSAVVNGTVVNNLTVSGSGVINTGAVSGTYFVIGFPYTAQIQMLTPEFSSPYFAATSPTLAQQKSFAKVFVAVYETTDLWFNTNTLDQYGNLSSADVNIPFLTFATGLDAQVAPITGLVQVDDMGWDISKNVWLKSPNPTECQIMGIIYKTGALGE